MEPERLSINPAACTSCGLCVTVCPARVLALEEPGRQTPAVARPAGCIVCGHCIAICPTDAIRHREIDPSHCPPISAQPAIPPEQLLHFLRRRRSERCFRPEPVGRDQLETLLEAARCAPSASNAQAFQFVVITERERIRRLAALALAPFRLVLRLLETPLLGALLRKAAQPALSGGRYTLDDLRYIAEGPQHGRDPILFDAPALILTHAPKRAPFGETDCANAQHQMALMAEALGLGATTIGFFIIASNFSRALRRELRLPAGHRLHGALVVGWPRYRWQRIPDRRPARARWE